VKRATSFLMPSVVIAAVLSLGSPAVDVHASSGQAAPSFRVHSKGSSVVQGYVPYQLRHAYGFDRVSTNGAGVVLAIVDAFDDPSIEKDVTTFISQLGLSGLNGLTTSARCTVLGGPHPCFEKLSPARKPAISSAWAVETSLDVEWAHAMAPGADILLVESSDSQLASLLGAVDTAVRAGAHVVSMSWGLPESQSELSLDSHFAAKGVTFTASSGDNGVDTQYPAASPYVVGVGGTRLDLDSDGNATSPETAWTGSGGGMSAVEPQPQYQNSVLAGGPSAGRGVPDVAYVADPSTGVAVYDSTQFLSSSGWFVIGGTSVGAPQWAALLGLADQGRLEPLDAGMQSGSLLYRAARGAMYQADFHDILTGANGICGSQCAAQPGYDLVTGLGSPDASGLVPQLSSA
jgi:subtilase family serine protease